MQPSQTEVIGKLLAALAVVDPVLYIGAGLIIAMIAWFSLESRSPGAMERRKAARRQLWLHAHQQQLQDKMGRMKPSVDDVSHRPYLDKPFWKKPFLGGKSEPPAAPNQSKVMDREAFEREVRRWD